jgi:hypothetical protein
MTPEEFLFRHTPEVQVLVQGTREIIRQVDPDVVETVNPGRGNLAYGPGAKMGDWYCYIAPFKSYMNLGFLRGTELPDPDGLLEGTGKLLRHVKIKSIEDVKRPGVRALLVAAASK